MQTCEAFCIQENQVQIRIPVKNAGKFRWKNRRSVEDYGVVFSTTNLPYTDQSYVEWQIGYDVAVRTYEKDPTKKPTVLTDVQFVNQKREAKYPYELSEYCAAMKKAGLVTAQELHTLRCQIQAQTTDLSEAFPICMVPGADFAAEGLTFMRRDIHLPNFTYPPNPVGAYVEVSTQKQQYASGVQPMVYLCIPLWALTDYEQMRNQTAQTFQKPYTTFVIDNRNKDIILNLFRIFGLCSARHKFDVIEILKILEAYNVAHLG